MTAESTHCSRAWLSVVGFLALALQGCSTPSEIKRASQKQLELIGALDTAVRELQASVDQFHRDQASLIRIEGRMQIAKAAVLLATDEDADTTADELFKMFENEVHPWILGAFAGPIIASRIASLEQRIQQATSAAVRQQLTIELNRLRVQQAQQSQKPETVARVEETVQGQLNAEFAIAANVRKNLELLRAQIALMKVMQTRVDDWLSIDLSPSQEQIDGLTRSIAEAKQALSGDSS